MVSANGWVWFIFGHWVGVVLMFACGAVVSDRYVLWCERVALWVRYVLILFCLGLVCL